MDDFYELNGTVRVRVVAGGHGGGATSIVDRAATEDEAAEYLAARVAVAEEAAVVEPAAEPVDLPLHSPVAADDHAAVTAPEADLPHE